MVSDWLRFLKSKKFMFLLSVLMLLGFALFLAGPKIMDKDFTESNYDEFTLEPYGNKTINVPLSLDQAFYMVSAHNLVLRNVVLMEINSSGPFTLYKLEDNETVKLAEHALFYRFNLSNVGVMAKLVVENEVYVNMNVKANIERVLTVKIADFTLPHVGFIIFITMLLTLQFLSVAANGDTLIGSILNRTVFKLRQKSIDAQKTTFLKVNATYGFILEIFVPILLLGISVYALMVYGQGLSLVENIAGYSLDYMAKIVLIGTLLSYFFTVVIDVFNMMFRSVKVWILESKGREFLKMYEKASKLHKAEAKIIFPLAFISLVAITIMIGYGFELKIILGTALCLCLILYAVAYHVEIKRWQAGLGSDGFNEILVGFIEIDAKTIGFWVLGIVAIFATFTMIMPLFSALTKNLLLLEFYPSFIYELGQSLMLWVNDAFTLFGQLQAPICLILTGPYWITRAMICKFEAKYKSRLLTDIAIFSAVFAISEYLKWTYSFFTLNQPYNTASLPISILIGMTASILKDLLTEIRPK